MAFGTDTERMSAWNGTYIVNDTTEAVKNSTAIYFPEDAVVARIEVNGDTVTDVKASYISTPGSPVKATTLMTTIGDDIFSAITLTSGSCVMILES